MPSFFEVISRVVVIPKLADDIIIGAAGRTEDDIQNFVCAFSCGQGNDQWLYDGGRAIKGAGIAPGFQEMAFGNVPVTKLSRFVLMRTEMRTPAGLGNFMREVKIRRCFKN